ncbi:SAM-dependent methyltransferase [Ascidiimonas sp. W6]|uniref:SAM-dependent methyltransferase n=1 Tax=Ascidiimonas meishanensis TaxID=3128903 RepID=UPI0030ED8026
MSDNYSNYGKLYLIPNMLGEIEPLEVLPLSIKRTIEQVDDYIVESEKAARKFIKKISSGKSQPSLRFFLLNKYTDALELQHYLEPCLNGKNMGIISDAGCPGVADPGALIVELAHQKNITVVPLVGPSSILLALMASGMNGQQFAFNGYLSIDQKERKKEIKKYEKLSKEADQSQIFIETPYRNDKLLADFLSVLTDTTQLCIACDLTLTSEYVKTKTVAVWKKSKPELHKRPCIFIIYKQ